MQRAALLWRVSPARLLAVLFALLVAAAMAVGSGANFTATSANPGNIFTAGALTHVNSKAGAAIFASGGLMKPGDVRTGLVDIQNTGSVAGTFTLAHAVTAQTAGAGGGQLAPLLDLRIDEVDAANATILAANVYTGKLSALGTHAMGSFAAGARRYYRFTITWPNGTPAVDNPAQSASTTVRFDWESTS